MQRGTVRKTLAMASLSALGFLLTAGALHLLPKDDLRLYAQFRSEKLAMMDDMRGTADVAAFGSSHVQSCFDPRAFDARFPGVHSVNLAVRGGSQTEQRAMALAYLRSLKANGRFPRLLVLEITAGANFGTDFLCHPRNINVADLGSLGLAKAFASSPLSTKQRVGRLGSALLSTGMYATNVGMVSNWVFRHELDPAAIEENTGDDRRGVEDGIATPAQAQDARNCFAQPADPKPSDAVLTSGVRRLVDDLADESRRLFGPERIPRFAYLVAPHTDDRTKLVRYPESIETSVGPVPVVSVGRYDLHPSIYRLPLWRDGSHVNAQGAVEVTRILADEIARRAPDALR